MINRKQMILKTAYRDLISAVFSPGIYNHGVKNTNLKTIIITVHVGF
jgi:hypothetical protein